MRRTVKRVGRGAIKITASLGGYFVLSDLVLQNLDLLDSVLLDLVEADREYAVF